MRFFTIIAQLINRILIKTIVCIRPFLGPAQCRFYETCTPYAIRQLKEKPPHSAIICIIRRLLFCSPFFK